MQLTNAEDNGGERGQGMSKQACTIYTVERLLLKQIVQSLNNHHYSLFYNNVLIRWLAVMSFSTPVVDSAWAFTTELVIIDTFTTNCVHPLKKLAWRIHIVHIRLGP